MKNLLGLQLDLGHKQKLKLYTNLIRKTKSKQNYTLSQEMANKHKHLHFFLPILNEQVHCCDETAVTTCSQSHGYFLLTAFPT